MAGAGSILKKVGGPAAALLVDPAIEAYESVSEDRRFDPSKVLAGMTGSSDVGAGEMEEFALMKQKDLTDRLIAKLGATKLSKVSAKQVQKEAISMGMSKVAAKELGEDWAQAAITYGDHYGTIAQAGRKHAPDFNIEDADFIEVNSKAKPKNLGDLVPVLQPDELGESAFKKFRKGVGKGVKLVGKAAAVGTAAATAMYMLNKHLFKQGIDEEAPSDEQILMKAEEVAQPKKLTLDDIEGRSAQNNKAYLEAIERWQEAIRMPMGGTRERKESQK